MLPSLFILASKTSSFVFDSENSIALAKRKCYLVVNTHRPHADFRLRHAEIRFRVPPTKTGTLRQPADASPRR
jgi:hypothetical protein